MTVNLFTFVDLFARVAGNARHLLTKGAEHARITGVDEGEMLRWSLIDDMQPLAFQLEVVANFARQWPARVAGIAVPEPVAAGLDVAGLDAALAESVAFLRQLTPEQFAGRDEVPLTFALGTGLEPTLPSGQWLSVFAATNLYFHLSTAYGILRSRGVPIGKADLFATGL